MGLGMFKKHRREREEYALASLAEAVDAAPEDEREAAQAALDLAREHAAASAKADAERDPAAEDVEVPEWDPVDEARHQEPGKSPDGTEDPEAIAAAESAAQEAAGGAENVQEVQEDPEGVNGAESGAQDAGEALVEDDKPKGNASTEEWAAYALAHGKTEGDLQGLSRDDIRNLFA